MQATGTPSLTIAELAEFAGFSLPEQRFIEGALDLALGASSIRELANAGFGDSAALRTRLALYRELRAQRFAMPRFGCASALDGLMPLLVRASAHDLAREGLGSFAAYRFLYERLLGAAARPWLPAAFCAAAALPQIDPERRRTLLRSLSETVLTAPGWSMVEPSFHPQCLAVDPAEFGPA